MDPFFIKIINDGMAKQLREVGATEVFVKRAVSTPASDLWMPSTADLVINHLVDEVTTRGFSDSGEGLNEFDARVRTITASHPFVQHLAATDPIRYASFEKSLRLAMRRRAPETELLEIVRGLANEAEIDRIPLGPAAGTTPLINHQEKM
jgi:hypothetical protein